MKLTHFLSLVIICFLAACNKTDKTPGAYLNPELHVEQRIELLLNEMTIEEKIGQLCMYVWRPRQESSNVDEAVQGHLQLKEIDELILHGKLGSLIKVPTYEACNYIQEIALQSRLKIPIIITEDGIHGHGMYEGATTIYPTEIGIASCFDTTLAYNIAKFTAREMRATGYHLNYSPNIEVVRDPRWGRTGETFGEDPFLVSMMGRAMVRGYQGKDFSEPENMVSCAKHFVGGGISITGINAGPADISERTLHEIFFPPFREAVNAGIYTLMPAHNEINGIPCHAHTEYLTNLIRDKWGFDGFYISDWNDVERLYSSHRITESWKDASITAFLSGIDMHMHGPGFYNHIIEGYEEGLIPIERINEAVRKILYVKFQLGLFENRFVDSENVYKTLLNQEHVDLALETARKSMVLLKNENNLLPLDKNIGSVFITGANANNQAIIGDWAKFQPEGNIITVLEGIKSIVSPQTKVDYLVSESYLEISPTTLAQAASRARLSDIAIVAVGENSIRFGDAMTSGENLDRPTLELIGDQLKLVQAVESAGKPVIVVFVNGGPIASPWIVEHCEGILEAWEPGMFGGQAIAEVIFGEYNPGGKLPITVPQSEGHIQSFYNHKPSANPGRRKFFNSENTPLFKFGHGLSYTQFTYSELELPERIGLNVDLEMSVKVQNTGQMAGDEVILVYLNDLVSSVTTPVRKLVSFSRVHLEPGESKRVKYIIENNHFKLYDKDMNFLVEPGEFDIIIGDNTLNKTVLVR